MAKALVHSSPSSASILLPAASTSRAEELGYAHAWFFDTHLLNAELFVAMGAAAVQTQQIRLGTGVMIPSSRIAPVAASGLASLNRLAPGRIDFGISTGFTARRTMGLGPVKLADMEEYVRIVQALLAGETTQWEFEGKRRKIAFMSAEAGVYNLADPIPLYIAAAGPRARRLAARLGANWIIVGRTVGHARSEIAAMQEAWRAYGHNPAERNISAEIGGCILAEDEPADSPRAKAQAGPTGFCGTDLIAASDLVAAHRIPVTGGGVAMQRVKPLLVMQGCFSGDHRRLFGIVAGECAKNFSMCDALHTLLVW